MESGCWRKKIEGRVPTVLLRKTGTFSEISTENLGYLGKKGTHFKKLDT
jgi:hypothetical protein